MFSVYWNNSVLDHLAEIYVGMSVAERERISTGVTALNQRLAADPSSVGESRDANRRVAFIDLLVVRFRVEMTARVVRVTGVERFGR